MAAIARFAPWRIAAWVGIIVVAGCGPAPPGAVVFSRPGDWNAFEGNWTAAGQREVLRLGDGRRASVAHFSGSLLLSGPSRPALGFRAEALVFNDSATGMLGRAVWTDARGDQAFSELRGEAAPTGNRIVGTFVGGTGRYAGATGNYTFAWRFFLEGDDGSVQGQSVGLTGRVRIGPLPPAGASRP